MLMSALLNNQKVLPVVTLENTEQTLGLAKTLLENGINVIEITLRHEFAYKAMQIVKEQCGAMTVLAGTVTTTEQFVKVKDVGVDGVVSPGASIALLQQAQETALPFLPGVVSASEIMQVQQWGFSECKLFPAVQVGGIPLLKALAGPFPDVHFCPTGGVGEKNYQDFLALDNVMCVGGGWLAPDTLIRAQNWEAIAKICTQVTSAIK